MCSQARGRSAPLRINNSWPQVREPIQKARGLARAREKIQFLFHREYSIAFPAIPSDGKRDSQGEVRIPKIRVGVPTIDAKSS